ncbi:Peptidase family M48 [Streptomyces sp. DI166]|uniref:M48 family metalloprotease n=1 Tax=Streptomyces sp. DI166 TaxID=1839783 RepID=UPI0007F4A400|nr:M48 family metalloprotease [Streptomyces sp. DI166]SBT89822.1 Peptidase family M48 [Streptomyces sp. DI166]
MSQAPPRADGRPARLWGPPPWLWVTLGLLAAQVPTLTDTLTWDAQGLGTEHGRDPAPLTALAQTLVQLLPTLFLLAGGLALVLPRVRARWVERHYGLGPAGIGAPVLDQMRGFLTDRVPSTELRVTRRRDMLARVYPGGGRTTRVGVFYPLVGLWESDREAAEAVLLHELGHIRCGEQHVAGLGSPFVALVKAWPYVFAVFCVLPVGLLLAAGNLAAHLLFAETVLVVLALPKVLLIVVGALWSAELAADRYAAGTAVRAAQWRALNALAPSRHRPLGRLYHPPVRVRLWFAARTDRPVAQLLLVLLWPVAVLVENLLDLVGGAAAVRLLGDTTAAEAMRKAVALSHEQLVSGSLWWTVLGAFAVWPLLAVPWARLWGWRGREVGGFSPAAYAGSVLLPALLLALGLLTTAPEPASDATAPAPSDSTGPAPSDSTGPAPADGGTTGATSSPSTCPSPSRPAAPRRPEGLPSFEASDTAAPTVTDDGTRSFRTVRVATVTPLSGSLGQARSVATRLAHARWSLAPDGTLTTEGGEVPVLRTTSVQGDGTRLLRGEETRTTDVSATTTWVDARLVTVGGTARLELVRAATGVTHAVVNCQEWDSTVTTAARLVVDLGEG